MYSIVENHSEFIVVSKQHDVCIHTEDNELGVIAQLKKDLQLPDLFPVHRLDKVTSGLLLCAKNKAAASELSQLFQERKVEKYYLAVSDKKPKKKQGLISGDMEKARRGSWKLCHSNHNPAVTQFFSAALTGGQRLFLLKPSTGKTHQLRVALKSIGSPIWGDRLYGHPLTRDEGICLHAYILGFEYQGQQYRYQQAPSHWQDIDWVSVNNGRKGASDVKNNVETEVANAQQALAALVFDQPWELAWPSVPLTLVSTKPSARQS